VRRSADVHVEIASEFMLARDVFGLTTRGGRLAAFRTLDSEAPMNVAARAMIVRSIG